MSKHIQIRDIPEKTHRALKARAAKAGMSMSEYLKRLIDNDLKTLTWQEFEEKIREMPPLELPTPSAELVRQERDSR